MNCLVPVKRRTTWPMVQGYGIQFLLFAKGVWNIHILESDTLWYDSQRILRTSILCLKTTHCLQRKLANIWKTLAASFRALTRNWTSWVFRYVRLALRECHWEWRKILQLFQMLDEVIKKDTALRMLERYDLVMKDQKFDSVRDCLHKGKCFGWMLGNLFILLTTSFVF